MTPYLGLLRHVRHHGHRKASRAVLASTGTKPDTLSVFGAQIRFDLAEGFPAVTTKRLAFRAVVEELLWFLRGETNVKSLHAAGVTIWDEWADGDGELGPVYGLQWRRWPAADGRAVDQIGRVIDDICHVARDPHHPAARRLVVVAWNPADVDKLRGPSACHTLFQFSVADGRLSCQLYQRSADLFLGVPFNIASYALLTHLVAKVTGLEPGEFVHTFGDAHIYENHLAVVDEQLSREPRPLPRLWLDPAITGIDGVRSDQIKLEGYDPWPTLRGEVAV